MLGRAVSAVFATAALISLVPVVFAKDLIVTPCSKGAGRENGCSNCDAKQAITATAWSSPPNFKPVVLDDAVDPNGGGGWDVWWVSSTSS